MYSDEQKDWIIPGRVRGVGGKPQRWWMQILSEGYTGDYDVKTQEDSDKNIYVCPSADMPAFQDSVEKGFKYSHYSINTYISGSIDTSSPDTIKVHKRAAYKAPQSVKFIMDNDTAGAWSFSNYRNLSFRHGAGDSRTTHNVTYLDKVSNAGITNCLFLDGHVESISWGDLRKEYKVTVGSGGAVSVATTATDNDGKDSYGAGSPSQNLVYVFGKGNKLLYNIIKVPGVLIEIKVPGVLIE